MKKIVTEFDDSVITAADVASQNTPGIIAFVDSDVGVCVLTQDDDGDWGFVPLNYQRSGSLFEYDRCRETCIENVANEHELQLFENYLEFANFLYSLPPALVNSNEDEDEDEDEDE